MSRKSRGKKRKAEAVPQEIDVLAEGSGPVEGAVVHVGIDTIAADQPEPAPVDELIVAAEGVLHELPIEEPPSADVSAEVEAEAVEAAEVEATADLDIVEAADAPAVDPVEAAAPDALEEISDEEAAEMGAVLPTSAASMDSLQLRYLVEALVFASDKPMTLLRLRQLTRVGDVRRLEQALAELAEDYKERGIVLQQVSGGYQFRTRTQFSTWVQQLIAGRPVRLSRAQLETLAIIAYRQPITRPEIDEIRGVDSSATLKLLLDRSLIRVLGKKEEVGRPMLYGTTKEFLDFFSLGDLRELPTLREYSELTDESRQVMSDELGIDPDADPMADPEPSDEELAADEPKPESIEDMVASYSASMDESATTGVFESHASDVDAASDVEAASDSEPDMAADTDGDGDAAVAVDSDATPHTDMAADRTADVAVDASADVAAEDGADMGTAATDPSADSDVDMAADSDATLRADMAAADIAADTNDVESETELSDFKAAAVASLESLARRRLDADAAETSADESMDEPSDDDEPLEAGDESAGDADADALSPAEASDAPADEDAGPEADALVAADATVPDLDDTANSKHDSSTPD